MQQEIPLDFALMQHENDFSMEHESLLDFPSGTHEIDSIGMC